MARLQQLYLVMPIMSWAPSLRAFISTVTLPLPGRIRLPLRREMSAETAARLGCAGRRWGPWPLLASAGHDVKDTKSIISEMEDWARVITPEAHISHRSLQYLVSSGSSLPEVLFDFWKAVSHVIDEHRATAEVRSFRKLVMFVAPYCEELNDYQTMEHVHQLLQQSATVGGCGDFGKDITHSHYHPNYRYRPRPKDVRMACRHSPYPAFGIEVLYRKGGLESFPSKRSAPWTHVTRTTVAPLQRPRTTADATPTEGKNEWTRREREQWAAKARFSLENIYLNTPASYGAEDALAGVAAHPHPLVGRGLPESSQEILEITQRWLRGALKDAAESDAAVAKSCNKAESSLGTSPPSTNASTSLNNCSTSSFSVATSIGDRASDRLTAAVDAVDAVDAIPEAGCSPSEMVGTKEIGSCPEEKTSTWTGFEETSEAGDTAEAGGRVGDGGHPMQEALVHTSEEHVPVRGDARLTGVVKGNAELEDRTALSRSGKERGTAELPGKELVKRMRSISQYIVARSKTAEEALGDVWEVISEMAERAAARGCSVPTEDYTSSSSPCYGALFVTPDLATCSSNAFFRFQETLNRGLKHLPMEHDISVEAFHPEAVSEANPLDHRFTRSPFPTLHLCYHGLRPRSTPLHPKPRAKAVGGSSSSSRKHDNKKKKRRN